MPGTTSARLQSVGAALPPLVAAALALLALAASSAEGIAVDPGPGIDDALLPPLPASYAAHCPTDRYLLLGPRTYTGGFNNMLMTFQAALLLARYTNRTFVVPAARNDRYNDFRFSWAVDYDALKPVWPCFFDSDTPWGEGLPPDADGDEAARALLASRGGKGGEQGTRD